MNDLTYEMYKKVRFIINNSEKCEKCEKWDMAIEVLEFAFPDFKLKYDSENVLHSEKQDAAFKELKSAIVQLMINFNDKYNGRDRPQSLYPKTIYILIDVLTDCLEEAQNQVNNYYPFTKFQKDDICNKIGEWYLMMKPLLEGQHNLGYMKEKLKTMICGD